MHPVYEFIIAEYKTYPVKWRQKYIPPDLKNETSFF